MAASSVTCDDKFKCSSIDCTQLFTTEQALLEHESEVHDAVKPDTTSDHKQPATEDQQPTIKSKLDENSTFDSDSTDMEDGDEEYGEEEEDRNEDDLSSDSTGDSEPHDPSTDNATTTMTSTLSLLSVTTPSLPAAYECLPANARPRTTSEINLASLPEESSDGEDGNYSHY